METLLQAMAALNALSHLWLQADLVYSETTVRSAHHQGDLEVDKGVGKQVCNPWLKLEPNMATECKYLLLIPPPPEAAGFVPAGMLPAYHKPLSRHIHHLMFYPGWRNARQRCRTADGAVRRLAPIPPCGARRSPVLYCCGGIP